MKVSGNASAGALQRDLGLGVAFEPRLDLPQPQPGRTQQRVELNGEAERGLGRGEVGHLAQGRPHFVVDQGRLVRLPQRSVQQREGAGAVATVAQRPGLCQKAVVGAGRRRAFFSGWRGRPWLAEPMAPAHRVRDSTTRPRTQLAAASSGSSQRSRATCRSMVRLGYQGTEGPLNP